jgi:hypothetical protein
MRIVHFDWLPSRLEQYPEQLSGKEKALLAVKAMAEREWETEKGFQIIHGDFSPGK